MFVNLCKHYLPTIGLLSFPSYGYSTVPCDTNRSNHVVQQIFVDEGSRDSLSAAFELKRVRLKINRNRFDSFHGINYSTMIYNIAGTISIIECGPLFV